MGKKKKAITSSRSTDVTTVLRDITSNEIIQDIHSTAADGRNIDGWSAADVKTYNDLLRKKEELEKEKNALEQKAERRSTERALMNRTGIDFETLFSKQTTGEYKFSGRSACCLDLSRHDCSGETDPQQWPCKHELCPRAKKSGVSWMELDTIKYYEMRIHSEKSNRMKEALRKQREVDLIRVKKVEEEERAARSRKTALLDKADREALKRASEKCALSNGEYSATDYQRDAILEAAKQNDKDLSQIRDELESIKRQVDAGKVTSSDLRTTLDLAQTKMGEAERRNNLFRQMILEAESGIVPADGSFESEGNLDDDLKKLCQTAENAVTQAMNIMKDFFSASGPDQMEETMTRLKSTLEARGPMPKNMRDSFVELENMVAESKAKGLKMDFKVDYGGVVTGDSMVETMMALRKKMKEGSTTPQIAGKELKLDKELVKANHGCLQVEEAAEDEMQKRAEELRTETPDALLKALTQIKSDAVAKSPIPPLSDIMLDSKLQTLLDMHNAKALVHRSIEGASDQEIKGKLTSWVLTKTSKRPEKFRTAFAAVKSSLEIVSNQRVSEQIKGALPMVERSMQAWADKQAQAQTEKDTNHTANTRTGDAIATPIAEKIATATGPKSLHIPPSFRGNKAANGHDEISVEEPGIAVGKTSDNPKSVRRQSGESTLPHIAAGDDKSSAPHRNGSSKYELDDIVHSVLREAPETAALVRQKTQKSLRLAEEHVYAFRQSGLSPPDYLLQQIENLRKSARVSSSLDSRATNGAQKSVTRSRDSNNKEFVHLTGHDDLSSDSHALNSSGSSNFVEHIAPEATEDDTAIGPEDFQPTRRPENPTSQQLDWTLQGTRHPAPETQSDGSRRLSDEDRRQLELESRLMRFWRSHMEAQDGWLDLDDQTQSLFSAKLFDDFAKMDNTIVETARIVADLHGWTPLVQKLDMYMKEIGLMSEEDRDRGGSRYP